MVPTIYIRSQDKTILMPLYGHCILQNNNSIGIQNNESWQIMGKYNIYNDALKVMNEIQQAIIDGMAVYEMPTR